MTRFLSSAQCGSPPVVATYASAAAIGTATTMPMSCSAERASHLGRRLGHCSNNPNASMAASPTIMARATTMYVAVSEGRLSNNPNSAETPSVNRTRRQPSI